MHKIYLLLRDNKQTGPHSLEELLQLAPKPMDLIWVEGRSAGWQYPTEVEALQPFLPYATQKLKTETAGTKEKPVTDKAKHIYISLPAGAFNIPQKISEPNILEESLEAKLERKAEKIRKRAQAYAEGQKNTEEEGELATKYSRSLEDMKAEYSDWLYRQNMKKRKLISSKKLAVAALALVVLAGISFAGLRLINAYQTQDANTQLSKETIAESPIENIPVKSNFSSFRTRDQKMIPSARVKKTKYILVDEKEMTKDPAPLKSKAGNETENVYPQTSVSEAYPKELPSTESPAAKPVATEAAHPPANTTTQEDAIPLARLIELSESREGSVSQSPGEALTLTLYNHSNQLLNMAAVDVFYYNNNGRLLKKKTIYFSNVPPQGSVSQVAPANKKAAAVNYELGLVSSEGGLYYARQ